MILGVRVSRDQKNRTTYLNQEQYFHRELNEYGFTKEKYYPKKIPVADYTMLRTAIEGDERSDLSKYQGGVGNTNHRMVLTKPDIAFSSVV